MPTASESPVEILEPTEDPDSGHPSTLVTLWVLLSLAVVAWLCSVYLITPARFGSGGLLPPQTIFRYAALLGAVAVCVYGVTCRGVPPTRILATGVTAALFMLYLTPPVGSTPARLQWDAQRRDELLRALQTGGGLQGDDGTRWPGRLTVDLLLTRLGQVGDVARYQLWMELLLALALGVLVLALAQLLFKDTRSAWISVLVFVGVDWAWHLRSPLEPVTLTLSLGMLLVLLRVFRRSPNRWGRRLEGQLGAVSRGSSPTPAWMSVRALPGLAYSLVMLLHLAAAITSPALSVIGIGSVGLLLVLGYLRSWSLLVWLVAISLATWLVDRGARTGNPAVEEGLSSVSTGGTLQVIGVALGVLALIAVVVRWKRERRSTIVTAVMVISPLVVALVPGSDGDARPAALSFALPWCSLAAGWLVAQLVPRTWSYLPVRRRVAAPEVEWVAWPDVELSPVPARAATPSRRERQVFVLVLVGLAFGVLAPLISLSSLTPGRLGQYGLPPALPIVWYAGLLVLVTSASVVLAVTPLRQWLAAVHLFALILVLYGSGVILAEAPRFAWTYKHIGVTRYISEFGSVDADIDIYHRWPGFFSLASMFGSVAGLPDPTSYAAWVGVLFVALQAALLVAIARALLGNQRAAWAAGLVFACINYVGQDYFAPQPLAFALALGVLWLILLHYGSTPGGPVGTRVMKLLSSVARSDSGRDVELSPRPLWGRRVALAVILTIYTPMVPTHQLSPYIVVIIVAGWALTRSISSRWLPIVLLVIALSFLVPNYGYVQQHFDVFSGFDPFSNAAPVNNLEQALPGKVFSVRAGLALTVTFAMLALISLIPTWRRGSIGVFHAAVALGTPLVVLLTQSYGGEGGLRIILFGAPWAALLIAANVRARGGWRNLLIAPLLVVLLAMFMPAYYGIEEINEIPRSEVVASDYLYAQGVAGSIVVPSTPGFPLRVGARYPFLLGERSSTDPILTRDRDFRNRRLGPADVDAVVEVIRRYGSRGYVIFSDSQDTYATVFGISSPEDLRPLEAAMVTSGRFRVFFQNDTTRIYELVA